MKTVYTTGDQKTESVSYQKGSRERFEFGDVLVLKQHDLKRTVQIVRSANTYLVAPDGAAPVMPASTPNTPPQKPGIVSVTTTIADTGERKSAFGLQARRVKTTIDRAAPPEACDPSKQRIETDGWYVDLPTPVPQTQAPAVQPAAVCSDEVKAALNGDPNLLGFPIAYSTTIAGEDGKPSVVSMEITELEITNLDAALFEIPAGYNEAGNLFALTKAVSDANEKKLAQELIAPTAPAEPKAAGMVRIGVPEIVNKTAQQVDTRALRGRLVSELIDTKLNAAQLAGSQDDLVQLAAAHGYDYVLVAEITELKVSKAGGFGGMLKSATSLAGGGQSGSEPTEATLAIRLVQPDGKARLSQTVKGKEGGFDLKAGLGVAKFAGSMYMNLMTGKMMMNGFNPMTSNLGGLGMLGNPSMANIQTRGLGMPTGLRMGMDPTAGAASFLMQQAMAGATPMSGILGQGPSFDAALGNALKEAAKTVSENMKKTSQSKK